MSEWPSRYDVAAELRRRNPERYGSMVNFSYTPGDGPPATLEQVADMVERAGDEAAHPILGIACRLGGMAFLMEDASKTRTDVRTMRHVPDPLRRLRSCAKRKRSCANSRQPTVIRRTETCNRLRS
jgi:hypothetical protein